MTKIHIGKNGPSICRAQEGKCPLGGEHFDSKEQAEKAFQQILEKEQEALGNKIFQTVSKKELESLSSVGKGSNENLARSDTFESVDFSTLDITVDLEGKTFTSCSFSNSSFKNVNMKDTLFIDCSFDRASFSEGEMTDVKFVRCNLEDAEFDNKQLKVVYDQANLNGVSFAQTLKKDEKTESLERPSTNLQEVTFLKCNSSELSFSDCGVENMKLESCVTNFDMKNCDSEGLLMLNTRLDEPDWSDSSFRRLTMTNSIVNSGGAVECDFKGVQMNSSKVEYYYINGGSLKHFYGFDNSIRHMSLDDVTLNTVEFDKCSMTKFRVENSRLEKTDLDDSKKLVFKNTSLTNPVFDGNFNKGDIIFDSKCKVKTTEPEKIKALSKLIKAR